jgi:hypothetical protein
MQLGCRADRMDMWQVLVNPDRCASELDRDDVSELPAVRMIRLIKCTANYFVPLIVDFSCAAVVEIVVLDKESKEVGLDECDI